MELLDGRVLWVRGDDVPVGARVFVQDATLRRGRRDREMDLVAEASGEIIPFEVKYRAQHTGARELKGLLELCEQKNIGRGYVVTKSTDDFGLMANLPLSAGSASGIMRIPAPLLCYWMGASEIESSADMQSE